MQNNSWQYIIMVLNKQHLQTIKFSQNTNLTRFNLIENTIFSKSFTKLCYGSYQITSKKEKYEHEPYAFHIAHVRSQNP